VGRTNRLLSCDTDRTEDDVSNKYSLPLEHLVPSNDRRTHRRTDTSPTVLLLLRVFFAAGRCLQSRLLETKGGIHVTKPLPSNNRRDKHGDTQTNGRDL
jgi:hypothetical protein